MARTAASTKLAKYRSMRDFSRTAEPRGIAAAPAGHSFVVQQHDARRLHYDFRLELDGVLLSWAVPRGPSLSPTARRLAVRTEDHPLDYADFEGVIPEGEYGGGTIVVWDRGSWEPEGDARAQLAQGKLHFTLRGEKLRGRWHLVKTRPDGKAENWLLFKARDAAANDEIDVLAERPASVLSGRTLDEVAAAPDRVWHSDRRSEPSAADRRAARIAEAGKPRETSPAALIEQLPLGFKLTNLDKVLFPEHQITKGDLIAYLAVVSEHALPHVADRPLMIARCPDGIHGQAAARAGACFYQKHVLPGSPAAIATVSDTDSDGAPVRYMQVRDMAGMIALAQLGTLEIHTWGAHADKLDQPDLLVIDLDPDTGVGWDHVALAALELRRRLADAGLTSFVKTTGGKGLHVVAPITRGIGWGDFKAFTKALVDAMQRDAPTRYTTNMAKAQRRGKIFLDYLRNGRGATFIAPYSPRARAGAPVAVPISWEELARGVDPAAFTIASVPRRLATLTDDPWAPWISGVPGSRAQAVPLRQSITARSWRSVGGQPRSQRGNQRGNQRDTRRGNQRDTRRGNP